MVISRIGEIASKEFRPRGGGVRGGRGPAAIGQTTGDAPPSMLIAAPVVKPARSEHRKQAMAANYSALPMRPIGTLAPIFALNSSYGTFEAVVRCRRTC